MENSTGSRGADVRLRLTWRFFAGRIDGPRTRLARRDEVARHRASVPRKASIELLPLCGRRPSVLVGLIQQRRRQLSRKSADDAAAALLRHLARLQEHLQEEPEVGRINGDGDVHRHRLNLASAGREEGPHCDAVHNQAPDHLRDLYYRDEWRDWLDDLRKAFESHEEEVHVHDGVDEVVRERKPQARRVLRRERKPAEQQDARMVVPLQQPNMLALENQEHSVAQLGDLRQAEEREGLHAWAAPHVLHEGWRICANCKVEPLCVGGCEKRARHVPDTPTTEQREPQVPDREAIVNDFGESVLRDQVPCRIHQHEVGCGKGHWNIPTTPAKADDASKGVQVLVAGPQLRKRCRQIPDGRHLRGRPLGSGRNSTESRTKDARLRLQLRARKSCSQAGFGAELMRGLLAHPQESEGSLPLPPEAARRRTPDQWNEPYDGPFFLHGILPEPGQQEIPDRLRRDTMPRPRVPAGLKRCVRAHRLARSRPTCACVRVPWSVCRLHPIPKGERSRPRCRPMRALGLEAADPEIGGEYDHHAMKRRHAECMSSHAGKLEHVQQIDSICRRAGGRGPSRTSYNASDNRLLVCHGAPPSSVGQEACQNPRPEGP